MTPNYLSTERKSFGSELRRLRLERRLTLQSLESNTGIKYSAIAAIEAGKRSAGDNIAVRLADGLLLRGALREGFLQQALSTHCHSAYGHLAKEVGAKVLRMINAKGGDGSSLLPGCLTMSEAKGSTSNTLLLAINV